MGQNESSISRQGFAQAPQRSPSSYTRPAQPTPTNPPLTTSNSLRRILSRTSLNASPSGGLARTPSRAETVQPVPSTLEETARTAAISTQSSPAALHARPLPQPITVSPEIPASSPQPITSSSEIPASSQYLEAHTSARPLSAISVNSIPPPPYTPIDEQALSQEMGNVGIQDMPVEPQTPITPPVSPRRASERRHRHHPSTSGPHRRTNSTSSTHIHQRELPPTPVEMQHSVSAPGTYPSDPPETSPSPGPAGTRYTSFQVQQPGYESGGHLSRESSRSSPDRPRRRNSGSSILEDPLALLRKYDTVIIVDDSVSMEGPLWWEARSALADIAGMAALYDVDGVDLFFVNDQTEGANLRNAEEVEAIFDSIRPMGVNSELGGRLEEFLLDYLGRLERYKAAVDAGTAGNLLKVKPVNYIIITDGVPTDDPESVIVSAARRLDHEHFPLSQVGIQFVQIGDDYEAAEVLKHLDDGLSKAHGVRDIVDWTHLMPGRLDANTLTKILLGGINRRVDGKG